MNNHLAWLAWHCTGLNYPLLYSPTRMNYSLNDLAYWLYSLCWLLLYDLCCLGLYPCLHALLYHLSSLHHPLGNYLPLRVHNPLLHHLACLVHHHLASLAHYLSLRIHLHHLLALGVHLDYLLTLSVHLDHLLALGVNKDLLAL